MFLMPISCVISLLLWFIGVALLAPKPPTCTYTTYTATPEPPGGATMSNGALSGLMELEGDGGKPIMEQPAATPLPTPTPAHTHTHTPCDPHDPVVSTSSVITPVSSPSSAEGYGGMPQVVAAGRIRSLAQRLHIQSLTHTLCTVKEELEMSDRKMKLFHGYATSVVAGVCI